ncbi:MAG: sialidase family protein [Bacteroidota bacterium]|nr:sialidase family protein [Bacteroidota bacterium]MDP4234278.1 sialidase family protein [Bacteroidota bacterium]MDP4243213.1 sialidase family protein [Bacteroidota bacterium]MDP4288081.1 sialidase family protein [Bacteroidota bacterium]
MRTFLWLTTILIAAALAPAYRLDAQPVNIRISDPSLRDPEEVSIALNPKNLNQLAAGANINYLFTSSDAGFTWDMMRMSSQYGFWGDPCLMFDDSGILYYEHLSGQNWKDPQFLWRMVVQRSTDAGRTFDDGEEIGLAPPTMQDKGWLGLDRSQSKSLGTIFESWNEDDKYGSTLPGDSSRIFFAKSSDHGMTWSDRIRVDDTGGDCIDSSNTVEGATTAASPNGAVNIAWSARTHIYYDRSTDGGETFGKDRIIAEQPGGWDFNVPGISRANGFPMMASDLNPQSPYYGRLYIMWSDQRRGVTDVYFTRSTDNGGTWSKEIRVNDDSSLNHHFFPSMSLDPVTGRIYLVFYDRRNYVGGEPWSVPMTDVYLARSTDGGESFTNEKVSGTAFNPVSKIFFGDYIGITAYNRHIYPVWVRMDDSLLSVWTAQIVDTAASATVHSTASSTRDRIWIAGDAIRPSLAFALAENEHVAIDLYDMLGRHVESLISGTYGAGEYRIRFPASVSPGGYLIRMTTISQTNDANGSFSTLVTKVILP